MLHPELIELSQDQQKAELKNRPPVPTGRSVKTIYCSYWAYQDFLAFAHHRAKYLKPL